jgi:ubiquinone/menaquinone biosynthesis C-methylase UbiE
MMDKNEKYIPALGHAWLTPLYDPLLRWGMREEKFKRDLIAQARLEAGHRVLDLGCGTATLTILAKQLHPDATVVGLDGDPRILEIGRAKAAKAGVDITLDHGMAFQLPYPDSSFDRVLSSLVLHHLSREDKQRTAREVLRVLQPGGWLHVVDFGRPDNALASVVSLVMRRLERASDNIEGLLPEIFRLAGFAHVEETAHSMTVVGTLTLYQAEKPK